MNLAKSTVLVTGAGGFIGSHLVETLVKRGAKVKAALRYNSNYNCENLEFLDSSLKRRIQVYFADLREPAVFTKAMAGVDIVFNLAALVSIPYSYLNPHEVVMVNTVGTLNLLKVARQARVGKFIQTSTSEVYGSPERVPIKETDSLKPQSPYSASKIGSDAIALSFYYSYGLPVAIIRPFNAFGPRQSARAVIPAIITQALAGGAIRLGSLTPRRDFTFVKDTVEGFLKVAESPRSVGEVINIGTGKDISVGGIVLLVEKILGKKLRLEEDKRRVRPKKSEVVRLLADISKAKRLLKWQPRFSFEEGLRLTVEFIARNPKLYNPGEYAV
jgi:dTDP-glucose 4,6-dehydratase